MAVILGAKDQLTNHIWFLQFEWGGNKFKRNDDDPTIEGHSFTSFTDATQALDKLGFTCYLMGDRYQPSRTLLQVTGCDKHDGFCEAVGSNCERLRSEPGIKPKVLFFVRCFLSFIVPIIPSLVKNVDFGLLSC